MPETSRGAEPAHDILVVDDEHAITQLVADTLGDEGYDVRVAHDGASALLEISLRPPALVLLDIAMPVMTGDELIGWLRGHGFPNLPIIVMTAGLSSAQFLAQGATAALPKPFNLGDLLDCVERHMPVSG